MFENTPPYQNFAVIDKINGDMRIYETGKEANEYAEQCKNAHVKKMIEPVIYEFWAPIPVWKSNEIGKLSQYLDCLKAILNRSLELSHEFNKYIEKTIEYCEHHRPIKAYDSVYHLACIEYQQHQINILGLIFTYIIKTNFQGYNHKLSRTVSLITITCAIEKLHNMHEHCRGSKANAVDYMMKNCLEITKHGLILPKRSRPGRPCKRSYR